MRKNIERIKTIFSLVLVAFLIFSSGFVFVVQADAKGNNAITSTIYFEKPLLKQIKLNNRTFTQIGMSDCLSHASPGNPALPIRPVRILLPQGKKVSNIKVSYHLFKEIDADVLDSPILPQQKPISTGSNESNSSFLMNETLYNSTDPIFDAIYSTGNIGFCRGFVILTINLYPVQYIPKTGKLYYFPEMNIKIDIEEDIQKILREQSDLLRINDYDIDIIQSFVINPDAVATYSQPPYNPLSGGSGLCNPADTYEYVIITNESLNNTVDQTYNWSDLLTHRNTYDGLNTIKVTVETIDGCSAYWNDDSLFNDSAAHMREFIKDAYQNWGTQYVVLGGDWDTGNPAKQIVPARIFVECNSQLSGDNYYYMPCDMYYSHLGGDWRDTVHDCWGGGKNSGVNDHYAEVFVGRITVDSAEQLSNAIKKIIWYDLYADAEFVSKAVFFGGDLGSQFSATSAEYMEEIRNGNDPYFYQCTGFTEWNDANPDDEFDISTRTYYDWGASIPGDYQTAINSGNACLINHLSHGTTTTALDMTIAQLESLTNSKYFFAYSQQCLSGRFTEGNTPEKIVTSMSGNNGAFALVWNTGYGWGSGDDTNGPNQFLQRHFWDYLFNTQTSNWQIGAAQSYAKDELSDYIDIPGWHYSWCYNWYSSHLFGDPAQTLKETVSDSCSVTDETPTSGATDISIGNVSLIITASDLEGDTMNITFRTNASGSWQDIGSNNSQQNGTYSQMYTFDSYNTSYWWSVNVTDITGSSSWANETYYFTTRALHTVLPPNIFEAAAYNKTQINLTWSKGNNATHTYIERHTSPSWTRGDGAEIYNDTDTSFNDTGLTIGIAYYYQAWGWDSIDTVWSEDNTSDNNITVNTMPVLSGESPANNSTDHDLNPSLTITVFDADADLMNVTFWTNATGSWVLIGNNISSSDGSYQQSTVLFSNCSTNYWWSVNCTDGIAWTNETYQFTTQANQAPLLSSENPSNTSTDVSVSTSSLTITINDPEGDKINWSIETDLNIGSIYGSNESSGIKSCPITGLSYQTTYYWYVRVNDSGSGNWTNATYWFTTEQESQGGNQNYYHDTGGSSQSQNNPPATPSKPNGTILGYVNIEYAYSTTTTDPDNDEIRFMFDWGDETTSEWTDLVESGTTTPLSHIWTHEGEYNIRAKAKDENGEESSWSDVLTVTIQSTAVIKEEAEIIIDTPNVGIVNQIITFTASVNNYGSEDEQLTYHWDFGDGTTETGAQQDHTYLTPEAYIVTVTARDSSGAVVDTTTFEVIISSESSMKPFQEDEITQSEQERKTTFIFIIICFGGSLVVILAVFWKNIKPIFSLHSNKKHMNENNKK